MTITHTVIARDDEKNVLDVVMTFSDRQTEIAVQRIRAKHPSCDIELKATIDEHDLEVTRK